MESVSDGRAEGRNVAGRAPAPNQAEALRRWVRESRVAQGLPPKVCDEAVLRDIAVLLDCESEG